MRLVLPSTVRSAEFRHASRALLHSGTVGVATGIAACVFFYLLERTETLLLGRVAGYVPLRPAGDHPIAAEALATVHLRPWVLLFIPALGALVGGVIGFFIAPETVCSGGNAFIDSFHRQKALIRKRVAPVKLITTVLTLGSGASGGREGPTMQLGAALGSLIGRVLKVTERERRLLLVAGTAGGMSAIFRTPLGAALFAVEALYRDDFESDALVPAIIASVTSYSIFITVFPRTGKMFAHAESYPFIPHQLPLYIVMAIVLSFGARLLLKALRTSEAQFARMKVPEWAKPGIGGLMLGVVAVAWILIVNPRLNLANRGAGILGSGYGAAQGAITGAPWLPHGWVGVELLAGLALVKIVATSFTLGSRASAGDFGPALAIGGLLGGAFGRAAQLLVDPSIDPGAFALVGMGTFYGGMAHVPVSSLVMVCEMAGSYDLLVPLMLAEGVAFVVLRRAALYHSQVPSRFESPAHASDATLDVLKATRAGDCAVKDRAYATIPSDARPARIVEIVSGAAAWQDSFPVLDKGGKLIGLLRSDTIRSLVHSPSIEGIAVAADVMDPPVTVDEDEDLHAALEKFLNSGARELPVVNETGVIVGFLDESDVTRSYHNDIVRLQAEHDANQSGESRAAKP